MPTGIPTKLKPCAICGKLFLPKSPASKICETMHYTACPICGNQMIWNTTSTPKPCSKECRKELTRRKNQEKYGCDHPMQNETVKNKFKQSMIDKYGVESPLQSEEIKNRAVKTNKEKYGYSWAIQNNDIRKKRDSTMINRYGVSYTLQSEKLKEKVKSILKSRYGVDNPMKCNEIRKKAKSTLKSRYGVDNPMKCNEIAQKSSETRRKHMDITMQHIKETFIRKYNVDNPFKLKSVQTQIREYWRQNYGVNAPINVPKFRTKMMKTMNARYGSSWYVTSDEYKMKYGHIRISKINLRFSELLTKHNVHHELEYKIGTKIYDVFIPETNTVVEINPSYTHSILGNHWNKHGIDKYYHKDKTMNARNHGYNCVNIWDFDDYEKMIDIIAKPLVTVYAKDCRLFKIHKNVGDEFIEEYDIHGNPRGQLLYLGLVYQGQLVQIMTFSKPMYNKNHYVELKRFCTKSRYKIIGGASRLLKFAMQGFDIYDIITYNDDSKFSGNVFKKIGMRLDHTNQPQILWTKENRYISNNLLYLYGKYKSDMIDEGYIPIYDCGTSMYVI